MVKIYTGNSIVDYLRSTGQDSSYGSRAKLAASKGIQNYTGSAEQNTTLLNMLKNGGATTQQPQAQPQAQPQGQAVPTGQPQAQMQAQPMQQQGGEAALIAAMTAKGHTPETAKAAIAGRGYDDLAREYLGAGGGGMATGAMFNQPTIDLPVLYKNLFDSSGITAVEDGLAEKTKAYNQAVSKIKDNPYLSEATMTGRLRKLDDKFSADAQAIQNQIAMKKADIETQLNLQTKQFDINSQQAQQAFNQFQTLLAAGALDSANGETIAGLTRATGISSDMINSAIAANKKKNQQTQLIQFDDGTNQGFTLIDPTTGEILKTQNIAASKPSSSGGGTVSERKEADQQATTQNLINDVQRGATLRDVVGHYGNAGGLTVEEIYRLYNTYSPYGVAGEDIEDVKLGKFNA